MASIQENDNLSAGQATDLVFEYAEEFAEKEVEKLNLNSDVRKNFLKEIIKTFYIEAAIRELQKMVVE